MPNPPSESYTMPDPPSPSDLRYTTPTLGWTPRPGVVYRDGITAECTYCHTTSQERMTDASGPTGWYGLHSPQYLHSATMCGMRRCLGVHYHPRAGYVFCGLRCLRLWATRRAKQLAKGRQG
jgi:hypothetical protein